MNPYNSRYYDCWWWSSSSFLPSFLLQSKNNNEKEEEEDEEEYEPSPSKLMLEDDDDLLFSQPSSSSNILQIHQLTVSQLKQQLRLRGLRVSGTKAQLIQRLSQAMNPHYDNNREEEDDDDDDDIAIVEDWESSVSSSWDEDNIIINKKKIPTRKKSSKAQIFANQRGKEFVDVTNYLDEKDLGKEAKSVYIHNTPSSSSTLSSSKKDESFDDSTSSYNNNNNNNPETWGDEAKIIDDYDGKSLVMDGLSRTIIEYRGSNQTMVQAYVVASKDSLRSFLAGGNYYKSRSSSNYNNNNNATTTSILQGIEQQIQSIQLAKEKASKLPIKSDDIIEGVDEDDEEGHYTNVLERDYGDWGKYSMTGVQFSSQEIKGLLLLIDVENDNDNENDGSFISESIKALADKMAFELQPIVVMVPDLFYRNQQQKHHKGKQQYPPPPPDIRVNVDIRAAAAALRRQYGVNTVAILGLGYGGGKALEIAGRVYPQNLLDDVSSLIEGPPHVNPSAVVAWYPTHYNATLLFGNDRMSLEAYDDYQTSVMALFAEQDIHMSAMTSDAEILKTVLNEDERIKDMMVKVFPRQKHGFAHKFSDSLVHEVDYNRFDQNEYGGEYSSLASGDAEAAYLLSSAFLETYSRTFLPTVGPPIEDDDNWSDLRMNDLSTSRSRNVRSEIENLVAKHKDVELDLGRMHPLDFMNPISDMEDFDKTLANAMKAKPYGLSPEDDADTMVAKLEAALERGDLGYLPGFGDIPMDDTEQAYW